MPLRVKQNVWGDGQHAGNNNFTGKAPLVIAPNPYVDRPPTPNAFDDEFDSGPPDLAQRGWRIYCAQTSSDVTRAGDVYFWGTQPALAANQYRSTIVGSVLYLQFPLSQRNYAITRQVDASTAGLASGMYAARISAPVFGNGGGIESAEYFLHGGTTSLGYAAPAANIEESGCLEFQGSYQFWTNRFTNGSAAQARRDWSTPSANGADGAHFMPFDVFAVNYEETAISADIESRWIDSKANQLGVFSGRRTARPLLRYWGVNIRPKGWNENVLITGIDYIRRYAIGSWFQ